MSGMHLLPVYYTNTNLKTRKKKRKVSAKMQAAQAEHEKFLKRMGYVPKEERKELTSPIYEFPDYSSDRPSIPTSDVIDGVCSTKKVPTYTGNAVIGQAYNKGGLQVLSTQEANDPMTGKRR